MNYLDFDHLAFGKHFGKHLCEVPTGYLRWMVAELDKMEASERLAVWKELARREISGHGRSQGRQSRERRRRR